jgi:hypothetical protein
MSFPPDAFRCTLPPTHLTAVIIFTSFLCSSSSSSPLFLFLHIRNEAAHQGLPHEIRCVRAEAALESRLILRSGATEDLPQPFSPTNTAVLFPDLTEAVFRHGARRVAVCGWGFSLNKDGNHLTRATVAR